MTYAQFKAKWLGKRINFDGVYGYQCVDLVLQYIKECYGISTGVRGNAIDYWYSPSAPLLKKFDRVSGSKARRGDIVIFKGINGNPYGHIGVCDGDAGILTVTVLEQNGSDGSGSGVGGNAIRTRAITRTRVVGMLRQKASKPALKMPPIGGRIKLTKGVNRSVFKAGTTKVVGVIRPIDNTYIYTIRGYDSRYPNRILINSASAGGNGVALALFYTSGQRIEGWTVV